MPLTFSVDHQRHRLVTTARGSVTPADVAQFFSDRITVGVLEYDQIVDVSAAQLVVRENDLPALTNDRKAALMGRNAGRTAWVAPTDEQYERAMFFRAQLEKLGVTVHIFRTSDEATDFLDQPTPMRPNASADDQ